MIEITHKCTVSDVKKTFDAIISLVVNDTGYSSGCAVYQYV